MRLVGVAGFGGDPRPVPTGRGHSGRPLQARRSGETLRADVAIVHRRGAPELTGFAIDFSFFLAEFPEYVGSPYDALSDEGDGRSVPARYQRHRTSRGARPRGQLPVTIVVEAISTTNVGDVHLTIDAL